MISRVLIIATLISLAIPAFAKDDRGIAIRPIAPTGETVTGDQWLLTIGIDNYLSWPTLKTAVNDAKALKNVLLERYTFDRNRVIELYDENATRKNILGALRDLTKKVKPEDSLLIFYAGHGYVDTITKAGSWIPVESGTDDASAWISNDDIKKYLSIDAIKARHVLLVSDSCFSGDFFRGQRGAIPDVTAEVIKKAYKLSSRQAITSGGLEPVSDAGFGGNSVFSHFLVAALKSNSNPYLIPSELFPAVKSGVAQNAEQFPQMGSLYNVGGQDGGEIVLFLKQENRLKDLSVDSSAKRKELEQLQHMAKDAEEVKQKELSEILNKERELAALDMQIAEMKRRLGTSYAKAGDTLDSIIKMVEKKEQQGTKIEELRLKRESEERKRQGDIAQLKRMAKERQIANFKTELGKYEKVVSSKYAQDMKDMAWSALIEGYPEAYGVTKHDVDGLHKALGLPREKGNFRFNDDVVTDIRTGLMWTRDAKISKKIGFDQATQLVKRMTYAGYNDWRLPSKEEMEIMVKYGGATPSQYFNGLGFTSVKFDWYWTSTSVRNWYGLSSSDAWVVYMGNGGFMGSSKHTNDYYLWPVRVQR